MPHASPPSRLFLIDGSGYIYRAYFGIKNLSRRDGFPTNAVFGFVRMLTKVIEEYHPDYIAMLFDRRAPTFRHRLDANYKANRATMPDDLAIQLPAIHDAVAALNVPSFSMDGFEADDLIGTLTKKATENGFNVVIVTSDKDLMQLVADNVAIFDAGKDQWIHAAEVEQRWGAPPDKVTQVMALAGDSSDNIPGVPKIGPKIASQLIQEFGDVETLLGNLEKVKQLKRRENLREFAEQARLSLRLVTLDQEVPLTVDWADLRCVAPDAKKLHDFYVAMEFTSLLRQLEKGASTEAALPIAAEMPITEEKNEYITITDALSFGVFLEKLQKQLEFSIDTETTSTDSVRAQLVGLSFSWSPHWGVYIPVGHTQEAAPAGQLEREVVLAALKPILENSAVGKIGQNIKYDYVVLLKYGIRLAGLAQDSMLLSHMIYGSSRRHNLDAIALAELNRTTITFKDVAGTGKNQLSFDQVPLQQAGPYACEDAEVAWLAAKKMAPVVQSIAPLWNLYKTVELPLITVLGEMEWHGALMDRATLAAMSKDFTHRREALVIEIHALAGESFNVNSTQQLGDILFEKMGIKGGKRTKTGFSTDVAVLSKLADQGHILPEKVLVYRTLTKLQSTYTDALQTLINPDTGRVHTSYNQAVTLTGRLSSSEPNLQNIPIRTAEGKAIRQAFIAPKGCVLLSADYSQIELRLLAHMGEVPKLREAFLQDQDIHAATAAELFGSHGGIVSDHHRRMAKTINFGLIYGMSPFGLAKRLGISNQEARTYMDIYFNRYQGVREYMDRTIQFARTHGYVTTIGGRHCKIVDIDNRNRNLREIAERTAINAPLQGSAADLIKLAMLRLASTLVSGQFRSRMILQVHDELVLEVPDDELDAIKAVVQQAMVSAMTLQVPLKVDIGVGANWAQAH